METIYRPNANETIHPDETEESLCGRPLDNDISIFHEFKKMGYLVSFTVFQF